MGKFIVTSEAKPQYNHYGTYVGEGEKRALCYAKTVGKRRTYRESFELSKGFEYQTYKTKEEAQEAADYVNQAYNDDFKVEELI